MRDDPPPILEAHDVHKHFGGLHAVDGVTLQVPRGSLMGIIGPNGAGKTTLFNVLAGYLAPTSGRVRLKGRDVTHQPAHRRTRDGLVRTFQITRALARMTVLENLLLAPLGQGGERWWANVVVPHRVRAEEARVRAKADAALEYFELTRVRNEYAGALSGGQRKLLELARALTTEPDVVLLDEPVAGVNPTLANKLLEKIGDLRRERDVTFVLVEHDLETVFRHCDPIVVMAEGRILAQGAAADIRADPAVIDAYLGA